MVENGLDLENSKVVIYNVECLRDYQGEIPTHTKEKDNIDFENLIDYSYKDLFHKFNKNIEKLKEVIVKAEKADRYYKFIELSDLEF